MPRIIQVHHSQLIHPLTHAYSFPSCHYIIIQSNTCQASKNRENIKPGHTLAQLFAQARGTLAQASSLRLGEGSTIGTLAFCTVSLRRDPLRLSETFSRSKQGFGRLSDTSRERSWASLSAYLA